MKLKKVLLVGMSVVLCLVVAGVVLAEKSKAELIADAESAAPASVTKNATIKASDGKVLREGSKWLDLLPGLKDHRADVQPTAVGRSARCHDEQEAARRKGVQHLLHAGGRGRSPWGQQ